MDSFDRCMAALLDVEVEGYGTGLRALGPDRMADGFFGSCGTNRAMRLLDRPSGRV
jgi:hypothetical protein